MQLGSTVSAVRSTRVLIDNEVRPAVVVIQNGKVHQIVSHRSFTGADATEVRWLGSPL